VVERSRAFVALTCALVLTACTAGSSMSSKPHRTSTTSTVPTTRLAAGAGICRASHQPPAHYESVVVFSRENRRWSDVGLGFGAKLPYLHALGAQCAWFPEWQETDAKQDSLTQYVGQVTGARQPGTVNDCAPSNTCSTRADNIF